MSFYRVVRSEAEKVSFYREVKTAGSRSVRREGGLTSVILQRSGQREA